MYQFDDDIFITSLVEQLSLEHMYNTNNGLSISINHIPLKRFDLKFKVSEKIKPAIWHNTYEFVFSRTLFLGKKPDSYLTKRRKRNRSCDL